jgi:hypothetical protein
MSNKPKTKKKFSKLTDMLEALAVIQQDSRQQGQLECPICKTGTLRFSKAPSNGHIHAACSTEGCVRFMQ